MPHTLVLNTLSYAKKLKAVGFTEEQAEVQTEILADLVDEQLTTKRDLKELEIALKRDIKELEVLLRRDMKQLETSLKHDMKQLESSFKHDMKELEMRLTIRLGIMIAATITIVAALVKLL